ncbi:MAG: alginate O-acetyltransferase complex protein AlgI [Frankiales bacterium]|nr:alginate O-acetyltransferase complex protein AlgI [Frankiales bacterium]
MVFNSLQYAVFLPVVLLLYYALRHRSRQNAMLLVASYVFYGVFDYRFLALMWFTTLVDFAVGRALERHDADDARRRQIFAISIVSNLGVLGFFKYAGFFVHSASSLAHRLGVPLDVPTLRILLPIGISFYTFHGISYTFDVYRRHISASHDLLTFAVFVAYFPQLVAGPIGRADKQLPQFTHDRVAPGREEVGSGLYLILLGLVKKVVVADTVAAPVNAVFANPGSASWLSLTMGALGFAAQIYGDFSGYSDIARGSSRLFGIELLVNFRQPYLSRSITEFWRTWHISLSSWLRDYLYVPLGGNRGSRRRTYRNLWLTMVIGGLWHGAAATFVVWGALHGTLLGLHRRWRENKPAERSLASLGWRDLPAVVLTFGVVALCWIPFRATSVRQTGEYLQGLLSFQRGTSVYFDRAGWVLVLGGIALLAAVDLCQRRTGRETPALAVPAPLHGILTTAAVASILVFSGGAAAPFIYFQF